MCLFCQINLEEQNIVYQNEHVYIIKDEYPVSIGHSLIITKRHIETYFETTQAEILSFDQAIKWMKKELDDTFHPTGYNIGINNGESAGQSIMHLHIHLIPRYDNDVLNPKGGVRGVIPGKQAY